MSREIVPDTFPDCIACGACCFSPLPTYLRIDGDDHERLGDDADALAHFIGDRCYMRIDDGRCAALVVDEKGPRFLRSIYEKRPSTCRELEPGSPVCRGERFMKADRVAQAVSLLRERTSH